MPAGGPGFSAPGFSVIVPVHDEADLLPETAPLMLAGLGRAEVVFVCNGCTDGSAALLRRLLGERARVIELPAAGKAAAIRAGEAAVRAFPRFYVDADVWIAGSTLAALARTLAAERLDLVSPRIRVDHAGASRLARGVTEAWMSLPHMRLAGFHNVLGVSAEGRARWGRFPDLLADDDFIAASIPPRARRIVDGLSCTIRPPRRFRAWVRVRARWTRGQRQLRAQGIVLPRTPGQADGLRTLLAEGRVLAVGAYVAAAALGAVLGRFGRSGWYRDGSSRSA